MQGSEALEAEGIIRQHFPFHTDLQSIFTSRMQRMLWQQPDNPNPNPTLPPPKTPSTSHFSSSSSASSSDTTTPHKKRKPNPITRTPALSAMREMMEEVMRQQMEMEREMMRWWEAREEERRGREMEWRGRMERMERERVEMVRKIKEREEEWRGKEEERGRKRDALIACLLDKIDK